MDEQINMTQGRWITAWAWGVLIAVVIWAAAALVGAACLTYLTAAQLAPTLEFEIRAREAPDAVRVIWVSGIVQTETELAVSRREVLSRLPARVFSAK